MNPFAGILLLTMVLDAYELQKITSCFRKDIYSFYNLRNFCNFAGTSAVTNRGRHPEDST